MEHICTHLRAHAQNNAEFRALIGEPRMGKVNLGCSNFFLCSALQNLSVSQDQTKKVRKNKNIPQYTDHT